MSAGHRVVTLMAVLAVVASLLPGNVAASTADDGRSRIALANPASGPSRLSQRAQELLEEATAAGKPEVVILVATKAGRGDSVARDLRALGASVITEEKALGYVSAIIATGTVKAASAVADVEIVDLDELIELDPPREGVDGADGTAPDHAAVPPGSTTPAQNPYMPTRDIGAPQFVAANPTWDGRGAVIGILDTGVDLYHPALSTTSTGDRKVVDWVTATHPIVDGGNDKSWIAMATQVTVTGGTFTVGTTTYTGAPDGAYRFGVFEEAALRVVGATEYDIDCDPLPPAGPPPADQHVVPGADVNRNGICGEKFAVLWRTDDDTVWVDANADRVFGEPAMRPYATAFDIGTFGTEDPATSLRDTVPFVVQVDGQNKYVNIGIVSGAHGSHVAGIAAGNDLFGGAFDGAAPGAQIVSIRVCLFVNSCTSRALIDGMIFAAKQADVDVINMSIGGLPTLNDGNNTRAILYNRLIEQFNVQMFISAGNSGPGVNTVGDPSVASLVMSVGAYVHADTWHANYTGIGTNGVDATKTDQLFVFSSRGPREDGGFKPDIVAPGSAVSTIPEWEQNFPLVGPLPRGYDMFNGTSMAAPQATGGAALLVSAAKQAGVQHQPAQLRQAIKSSATYLPYYGALEQGAGLFKVGAAWDLLKQNLKPVEIATAVPVKTVLSQLLATPNVGVGIHEREGVFAGGASFTRTYTLTRRSGGAGAITYDVTWVGNDGTFSSPASVALPLNKATSFAVSIAPGSAGAHSALMRLDDPATAGIDLMTMNTVVTSVALGAANGFTATAAGSADRPDTNKPRHFFTVPTGMTALRVKANVTSGRMRLLRQHPQGFSIDSTSTTTYCTAPCSVTRIFTPTAARPIAGAWELTMDNSRSSPASVATYDLTVEAFAVTIDPSSWDAVGVSIPSTKQQDFTITNNGATFTGNAAGTFLGSAYEEASVTFTAGSPSHVRYVNVPSGTSQLVVNTFQNAGPTSDLDVFVFRCSGTPLPGTCTTLVGSGTGSTTNETITVNNPTAALYKVVVEEFSIPSGTTSYRYFDVLNRTTAFYGQITVADAPASRPAGTTWTVTATASLNVSAGTNPPADGTSLTGGSARFLRGFVNVVTGSTVLGQAEARFFE